MNLSVLAMLRERVEPGCPEALLHEGLPATDGVRPCCDHAHEGDGDPIDAWLHSRPDRRATGLFLTRVGAARELLRHALDDGAPTQSAPPRRILDPAVGAGVFLEEAWTLLGPAVELHGIDIDPVAVALTRLALWKRGVTKDPNILTARIRWGDALRDPQMGGVGAFDLVCGNPPFGNAIEKRTGRGRADQQELRERFPETAAGAYDRSVLFVHLAARALAPGGRYALLIPCALLSARYATRLRGLLVRDAAPRRLVLFEDERPAPDCAISLVGLIGGRSMERRCVEVVRENGEAVRVVPPDRLSDLTWGALMDRDGGACEVGLEDHPTFGDLFEVRASMTVAEAYEARGVLQEDGAGWRFLTSGLVEHHGDRWGREQARHLGRVYARPVLPRGTGRISAAREDLLDRPKVIVAGLSRTLEARLDLEGRYAGSVGTMMLIARSTGPESERLLMRAALLLNSDWLSSIHRARRGPQALSGGSLPLGRQDIAQFPFPAPLAAAARPRGPLAARIDALDQVAAALSSGSSGSRAARGPSGSNGPADPSNSRGPSGDIASLRARGEALIREILIEDAARRESAKCTRFTPTSSDVEGRTIADDDDDLSP